MKIYINDQEREVGEETNVEHLVESLDIKRKKGIAVAIDNQVVTRDLWPQYYLKENARVVIITATQGG